jgi:hypothetical protein
MVISFRPGSTPDPDRLDGHLFLPDSLPLPDLAEVAGDGSPDDLALTEHPGEQELRIPGTISANRGAELEEAT